jgi:serine/threonine-protein kinase
VTDPKVDKRTINGVGRVDAESLRETNAWAKRERRAPAVSLVGQTVGSYRVTRVLGEGGVGIVYLGEHPRVGSRVAIKVLHEGFRDSSEMVQRFVQEARAANAIANPHIVRVSDFGTLEDGRDYAVMEYLEGRSLDATLSESHTLPVDRVVEIMSQIAETMVAAHAANIVHRDLKPENLFLEAREGSDFVRVLDFGIAKLADTEDVGRMTAPGAVLGTPVYCAPEQAAGAFVDFRADIYALGAVAYELLTGRTVFEGNVVEVLVAKMTREAPPLNGQNVPQALETLISHMLVRDPRCRPASMTEVLARLAPLRNGHVEHAPPTLSEESASSVAAPHDSAVVLMRSGVPLPRIALVVLALVTISGGALLLLRSWATDSGSIPAASARLEVPTPGLPSDVPAQGQSRATTTSVSASALPVIAPPAPQDRPKKAPAKFQKGRPAAPSDPRRVPPPGPPRGSLIDPFK